MAEESEEYADVVCFVAGDKIELVMASSEADTHVLTMTIENVVDLIALLEDAMAIAARYNGEEEPDGVPDLQP